MEVKVEKKDKHAVEITFAGEDVGMVQAIRDYLIEDEEVEFAGVMKEHPETTNPKLILKVKKGDPIKMVVKAADKVAKVATELKKKIK